MTTVRCSGATILRASWRGTLSCRNWQWWLCLGGCHGQVLSTRLVMLCNTIQMQTVGIRCGFLSLLAVELASKTSTICG
jgi:hypothetical protein